MKRAVTLVELMIVLVILGILSAILFPVLASSKEGGKNVACANQLKQLVLASLQYASDHEDRLPRAVSEIEKALIPVRGESFEFDGPVPDRSLLELLGPYKVQKSMFKCPKDWMSEVYRSQSSKNSWFETYGTSYEFANEWAMKGYPLTNVNAPSTKAMHYDAEDFHHRSATASGKVAVGFFDGHSELVTLQQVPHLIAKPE